MKDILLKSDCELLENAFKWAQQKTRQFVVTGVKKGAVNKGDGGKWYGPKGRITKNPKYEWAQPKDYIPSFWAGYYDRTAFYIRDFVHQAVGAHLSGLDDELFSMYKTFIDSAGEETGGYALWAFNFDGSVYYMDTPDHNRFVRELPAQFELVETAYRLYLWTGDRRYIFDDSIFGFIKNIMTDFIDRQDGIVLKNKNGIPEGLGDIWKGSATYNERGFHAAEAGDCIGAMYQAMLAYSAILKIRGDNAESHIQKQRADKLKQYFNHDWSVVEGSDAYCYAIDNNGKKHFKWYKKRSELHGGASLVLIPVKELAEGGCRTDKLLDHIHLCQCDKKLCEDNIESYTYLPQAFFPYNHNDRAWYWMKHIMNSKDLPHERRSQGTNGDYPEISFTFLEHTISGLMGITPDCGGLWVIPHLPKEIGAVQAENIPLSDFTIDLTVEKSSIKIKNNGAHSLPVHAGFPFAVSALKVNERHTPAIRKRRNGYDISYASIEIAAGKSAGICIE